MKNKMGTAGIFMLGFGAGVFAMVAGQSFFGIATQGHTIWTGILATTGSIGFSIAAIHEMQKWGLPLRV